MALTAAPICPACGTRMRPVASWLVRCPDCGLALSTLEPGSGTGIDGLEALRRANFEVLLDRIEALRPLRGGRLLEIGCAKGWFLEAARARGLTVQGVEPEAANARIAAGRGFTVENGFFPHFPSDRGPYDFVVFNDVFEHLPDPSAAIAAVAGLLKEDGWAVINLPSSTGTLYRIAGALRTLGVQSPFERLWQKGLPSPHTSYFSPRNLALLAKRQAGLREVTHFSLATMSRSGLRERIAGQPTRLPIVVTLPALWLLSHALPALPADITVSVFAKG